MWVITYEREVGSLTMLPLGADVQVAIREWTKLMCECDDITKITLEWT